MCLFVCTHCFVAFQQNLPFVCIRRRTVSSFEAWGVVDSVCSGVDKWSLFSGTFSHTETINLF